MAKYDYDLFVIGAGSGGVRAARLAAMSGAKVAVAEEDRVGGTCVIRGCVPKKFMVYASEYAHHFKTAQGYGWTVENATFDWPKFLAEKDKEIARLSGIYVRNLQNAGAELARRQVLRLPSTLRPSRSVRWASARPTRSSSPPADGPGCPRTCRALSSRSPPTRPSTCRSSAQEHRDRRRHGYIAVEFAGIFNGLGGRRDLGATADPTCCAASMTTCAPTSPRSWRSAGSR